MFFILSKIFDCIVTPLFWVMICFLAGLLTKKVILKKRLLWISFWILIIFTNPWIVGNVMRAWEIPARAEETITLPYDVGIVLGGSMRYFDIDSKRVVYSSSVDRMLQALELYHDGKIRKILLSGGSGYINFQDWKESALIADVLLKSGVKKEDLILENNSRNTYENAIFSADILKHGNYGKRYLLITSAFHMRRSVACFNKAGISTDTFSADTKFPDHIHTLDKIIEPGAEYLWLWDALIHEWVGMFMYRLAGYI